MFWRSTERKLPLLGVRGAGKTYFLLSLGYLVSEKGWGQVVGQEGSVYLEELLPYVFDERPIPPTRGNYPVEIEVDTVDFYGPDGHLEYDCEFVVSTEDFSGGEFENAMSAVETGGGFDQGPAAKFRDLYAAVDGLVVVVDLVQGADPGAFRDGREDQVVDALSNQVVPLAKGLEMALANSEMEGKPIYFVFSKADVHGMDVVEIEEHFRRVMAIPLARLENRGCEIQKYSVSAVGWADPDDASPVSKLEDLGYDRIIKDMARRFG